MFNNSDSSYLYTPLLFQFIKHEKNQSLLQLKETIISNEDNRLKNLVLFIHGYYRKSNGEGATAEEKDACIGLMRMIESYNFSSEEEKLEEEFIIYSQLIQDIELGIEGTFWDPLSSDQTINPSIDEMKSRKRELKGKLEAFQMQSAQRPSFLELAQKITSKDTSDLKELSLFIYDLQRQNTLSIEEQNACIGALHKVIDYSLRSKHEYRAYKYLLKFLDEIVEKMDQKLMIQEDFISNCQKNQLFQIKCFLSTKGVPPSLGRIKLKKQLIKVQYSAFDSHTYLSYFGDSLNHLENLRDVSSKIEKTMKEFSLAVELVCQRINTMAKEKVNCYHPDSLNSWYCKIEKSFEEIKRLSLLPSSGAGQGIPSHQWNYYKNVINRLSDKVPVNALRIGIGVSDHSVGQLTRLIKFCSFEEDYKSAYKAHIISTRNIIKQQLLKNQELFQAFHALNIPVGNLNAVNISSVRDLAASILQILNEFFHDGSKNPVFSIQNFLDKSCYCKHLILNYVLMQQKISELQKNDELHIENPLKVETIALLKEWTKNVKQQIEKKLAQENAFPINCKFQNKNDLRKEALSVFQNKHGRAFSALAFKDKKELAAIEVDLMPMDLRVDDLIKDSMDTTALTRKQKETIATFLMLQKYQIAVNDTVTETLKKEFDAVIEEKNPEIFLPSLRIPEAPSDTGQRTIREEPQFLHHTQLLRMPEISSNQSIQDLISTFHQYVDDFRQKFQLSQNLISDQGSKCKNLDEYLEEIKSALQQAMHQTPLSKKWISVKEMCEIFFELVGTTHKSRSLVSTEMLFHKLSETVSERLNDSFKFGLFPGVQIVNEIETFFKGEFPEHYSIEIQNLLTCEIKALKERLKEEAVRQTHELRPSSHFNNAQKNIGEEIVYGCKNLFLMFKLSELEESQLPYDRLERDISEMLAQKREGLLAELGLRCQETLAKIDQMIGDLGIALKNAPDRGLEKYFLKLQEIFANEIKIIKEQLKERACQLVSCKALVKGKTLYQGIRQLECLDHLVSFYNNIADVFKLSGLEDSQLHYNYLSEALESSLKRQIEETIAWPNYRPSTRSAHNLFKFYETERKENICRLKEEFELAMGQIAFGHEIKDVFKNSIDQLNQIPDLTKKELDEKVLEMLSVLGTTSMSALYSHIYIDFSLPAHPKLIPSYEESLKEYQVNDEIPFYTVNHLLHNGFLERIAYLDCSLKQIEQLYLTEMKIFYTAFIQRKKVKHLAAFLEVILSKFITVCHKEERYQKNHLILLDQLVDNVMLNTNHEKTELYLLLEKDLAQEITTFEKINIQGEARANSPRFLALDILQKYFHNFFDNFDISLFEEEKKFLLEASYNNVPKILGLIQRFRDGENCPVDKNLRAILSCLTFKELSQLFLNFLLKYRFERVNKIYVREQFCSNSEFKTALNKNIKEELHHLAQFLTSIPPELKTASDLKTFIPSLLSLPNVSKTIKEDILYFNRIISPLIDEFQYPLSHIEDCLKKSNESLGSFEKMLKRYAVIKRQINNLQNHLKEDESSDFLIREEKRLKSFTHKELSLEERISCLDRYSACLSLIDAMFAMYEFPKNQFVEEILFEQDKFEIFIERSHFVDFFWTCGFQEYPLETILFETIFNTSEYNKIKNILEGNEYELNLFDGLDVLKSKSFPRRSRNEFPFKDEYRLDLSNAGRAEEFRHFVCLRYGILATVFQCLELLSLQNRKEELAFKFKDKQFRVVDTTACKNQWAEVSRLEEVFATAQYSTIEDRRFWKDQARHDETKAKIRDRLRLPKKEIVERGHLSFFPRLSSLGETKVIFLEEVVELEELLKTVQIVWHGQEFMTSNLENHLRPVILKLCNQVLHKKISASEAFDVVILKTKEVIEKYYMYFIHETLDALKNKLPKTELRYSVIYYRTDQFIRCEKDACQAYYDFVNRLFFDSAKRDSFCETFNNTSTPGPFPWDLIKSKDWREPKNEIKFELDRMLRSQIPENLYYYISLARSAEKKHQAKMKKHSSKKKNKRRL